MFKDYYAILDVMEDASLDDINNAFRKQAKKWHPDKNPDKDTTRMMQDINEAYVILKDDSARTKYNIEYQRFKVYRKEESIAQQLRKEKNAFDEKKGNTNHKYEYPNYKMYDETLKNWMKNAARQAIELAQITIKETRILMGRGMKEAGKEMANYLIAALIISLISLIILMFSRQ